jgi:hypothetical protein
MSFQSRLLEQFVNALCRHHDDFNQQRQLRRYAPCLAHPKKTGANGPRCELSEQNIVVCPVFPYLQFAPPVGGGWLGSPHIWIANVRTGVPTLTFGDKVVP